MEISIQQTRSLKAIAILMMLCSHLFNNHDYQIDKYFPLIFFGEYPVSYYIGVFCASSVPIYLFVSGYGLFYSFNTAPENYVKKIPRRLLKLYIVYWVVLLLFPLGLGVLTQTEGYPEGVFKFVLSVTGLTAGQYNGAAWFFTTYVILVLLSNILFKTVNKYSSFAIIGTLLVIYFVSFYFRVYKKIEFNNSVLDWLYLNIPLVGTSLFCFILGAIAKKCQWNTVVHNFYTKYKFTNYHSIGLIFLLFMIRCVIPNFIVAAFIAIPFIFIINQIKFSLFIENYLQMMINHSTNFWLTHMYIYKIFFTEFIFGFKYPIIIFTALFFCCLLASMIINYIKTPILKILKL